MILITIKVPFCYFKDIFHLDGKKWKTIGIKEIDNSTEHDQTFYMWPTFWQHMTSFSRLPWDLQNKRTFS